MTDISTEQGPIGTTPMPAATASTRAGPLWRSRLDISSGSLRYTAPLPSPPARLTSPTLRPSRAFGSTSDTASFHTGNQQRDAAVRSTALASMPTEIDPITFVSDGCGWIDAERHPQRRRNQETNGSQRSS